MTSNDIKALIKSSFKSNSQYGLTAIKETTEKLESLNKIILTIEIKYNEAIKVEDLNLYPTVIIYKKEIIADEISEEILLQAYIELLNSLICNGCTSLFNLQLKLKSYLK